ncbi:AAA family ATPase [Methylorubrum extorquens]|uniref:AAA family ATPase n=1 Tax=Methylorubrum TaxID=2282523 RepID=UPI000AA10C29|nr:MULTISPECIES: AAA family ATPase [Methylorubrum]MDF9861365.1 hypothetical protein [Methylorubrum pseudosasae]MDH6634992.1 hypothetical protein [Methylobacterium sp. SuP10 SLI 274]MCP1561167.1 hypothetical protein [Methylorubrum extorquens]MDF9789650.1 hypothetical protein [Methylorubrum extorquens]BDL38573.1 hypothetical protein MSPGM_11630 [Methylorubrum sp. GM97]
MFEAGQGLGGGGAGDVVKRVGTANGRFWILAVGDPRQCSSVATGPVIELLWEALGKEAIPEILTTARQREQGERETTGMFRQGRAVEALLRKRRDGTARLVPGSPATVAEVVADFWTERHAEHANDPTYSLSVSAPPNADALMLASAIRGRKRKAGELIGPDHLVQATDNVGRKFGVTLAVGDRVRLFAQLE